MLPRPIKHRALLNCIIIKQATGSINNAPSSGPPRPSPAGPSNQPYRATPGPAGAPAGASQLQIPASNRPGIIRNGPPCSPTMLPEKEHQISAVCASSPTQRCMRNALQVACPEEAPKQLSVRAIPYRLRRALAYIFKKPHPCSIYPQETMF